jgi:hypothetical protein
MRSERLEDVAMRNSSIHEATYRNSNVGVTVFRVLWVNPKDQDGGAYYLPQPKFFPLVKPSHVTHVFKRSIRVRTAHQGYGWYLDRESAIRAAIVSCMQNLSGSVPVIENPLDYESSVRLARRAYQRTAQVLSLLRMERKEKNCGWMRSHRYGCYATEAEAIDFGIEFFSFMEEEDANGR